MGWNTDSTLEDWILLGLKLHHPLPVIAGIDLKWKPCDMGVPEGSWNLFNIFKHKSHTQNRPPGFIEKR
ncbi:MAG TPA: hypothetical protein VMW53_00060 [archaeon]|nr:hypothetical protein [archaeon]